MANSMRKQLGRSLASVSGLVPNIRRTVRPTETVGRSGTAIYGGYIVEDEKNQKLTGTSKYRTYSNILANTAIVAAGVRYFINLVAKADWAFEAAQGEGINEAEAQRLADLANEIKDDMETPWVRVVKRAAMFHFYGYSLQEWTAKRREDGVLGFLDVAPRPQVTIERWDVDETGKVLGVVQRDVQTQEEIYIPRAKMIYTIDDTLNDSPIGLGLFRHIVDSAERLKRFEQLEAFGFETDLHGMPVARAPIAELDAQVESGEITEQDKGKILQPLRDFITNRIKTPTRGMMLDSITYQTIDERGTPSNVPLWDLDVVQSEVGSFDEVANAIERLNREIARVLGVEGLLLGSGAVGSQALARDKSQSFDLIVESVLITLKQTIRQDYLTVLWSLNGWDFNLMPTIRTEAVQYRNASEITAALRDLATAGAVMQPDDPAINEVRELLGLSKQLMNDLDELGAMALTGGDVTTGQEAETVEEVAQNGANEGDE